MTIHSALDATTRVALAAYLHDLGKLAERAGAFAGDPRLEVNLQLYCPYHEDGRWFSHRHAACTALAIDLLEPHLPPLVRGDPSPFAARRRSGDGTVDAGAPDPTDSLINAAAAHHRPNTFLQWIIATADRVASGFEREEFERYNLGREETATGRNHYQARQLTLFEQIQLEGSESEPKALKWRYPLAVMSPAGLFPQLARDCEPSANEPAQAEYDGVWRWFLEQIQAIPPSHRAALPLWMDHFDSLWMAATHAVPAATAFGVKPEVSLYDHSRTTAALAAALWRWHEANGRTGEAHAQALRTRSDFDVPKFLLVQGDFFGIQDFIFAAGGQTQRQAAKLLRGRSLQVSLFTEAAALRILDALGLPPTSQVINAAGKFLIVAPDTVESRSTLERLRGEFAAWFESRAYGMAGIGLAWEPACCNDFLHSGGQRGEAASFGRLLQRLHHSLEREKYRRFDLAQRSGVVFHDADYRLGPCAWNGRLPADRTDDDGQGGTRASCALSRDQIRIGEAIVGGLDRLLVVDEASRAALAAGNSLKVLEVPLFGYALAFTRSEEATGRFGALAGDGALRRCWDFSAPDADDTEGKRPLFRGYARRFVSGHVPRVAAGDAALNERYVIDGDELIETVGELKTLGMLACEDRVPDEDGRWRGVVSLGVLKGDIDDLGEIFRAGLRQPSFAKWAALSRQVNGFFAIWLPWLLAREYPGVYTVFAGGDDFFLVGPWRTVQKLAGRLRDEFARYVAGNPGLHFSAGIATVKPGTPVQSMAAAAEDALERAKSRDGKNAVTCFGETVAWFDWPAMQAAAGRLEQLRGELDLSTGYVYGLLQFVELHEAASRADRPAPEATVWRSRLAYRTRRMLERRVRDQGARQAWQNTLMKELGAEGIARHGVAFRIPLFNHLYRFRDR
ncbi:type III-A CRISPR-associated protein Cas10/Csm1 [Azohydromonas sediminis]|uniref:type III-A CRISPR-associated protein Cas10/Csm1 n=1 Tax=Azohydromonas sediminis TaxID=2259674 RepID=UPI000E646719|nr:type III-A CRISPR-associated protein Cas10/Csm1 [Azohydromonas sediminis]